MIKSTPTTNTDFNWQQQQQPQQQPQQQIQQQFRRPGGSQLPRRHARQ